MLRKKYVSIILSIVMCSAMIFASGCFSQRKFTVTFSGGADDAELYYGKSVQVVSSSNQIIEPIYVRPGYNFVGWNKSISRIDNDTTVKAQWKQYTFEVTFLSNGGQTEDGNKSVVLTVDSAYELAEKQPQFIKEGYDLSWSIDLKTITSSCTVHAVWTPVQYALTFKDELSNDFLNNTMSVEYNANINSITINPPQKADKKFAYWADGLSEDALPIDDGIIWQKDSGEILYPHYVDSDNFVIKYNLAGGNRYKKVYSFNENTGLDARILTDPERTGYEFMGWLINDGSVPKLSEDVTVSDFLVDGHFADVSLKAVWRSASYILEFDTLGGTIVGNGLVQVDYGQPIPTLPTAEKEHYDFIGWYYDGKMIEQSDIWLYSKQVTLVAKYKAHYKLRFSLDGVVREQDPQLRCELVKWGSLISDGQTGFEQTYLNIKEGQSLYDAFNFTIMPLVKPIEQEGMHEYNFSNKWLWIDGQGGRHEIYCNTILNDNNLLGIKGGDEIVLVPYCRSIWSPLY